MEQTARVNMVQTNFFGAGAINQLPEEVKKRGYKRALVITDAFLYETGVAQKVCDTLQSADVHSFIYYGVEPNPTIDIVNT